MSIKKFYFSWKEEEIGVLFGLFCPDWTKILKICGSVYVYFICSNFLCSPWIFYSIILGTHFYWFYGFINLFPWSDEPKGMLCSGNLVFIRMLRPSSAFVIFITCPAWLHHILSQIKTNASRQPGSPTQTFSPPLLKHTQPLLPESTNQELPGTKQHRWTDINVDVTAHTCLGVCLGLMRALGHTCWGRCCVALSDTWPLSSENTIWQSPEFSRDTSPPPVAVRGHADACPWCISGSANQRESNLRVSRADPWALALGVLLQSQGRRHYISVTIVKLVRFTLCTVAGNPSSDLAQEWRGNWTQGWEGWRRREREFVWDRMWQRFDRVIPIPLSWSSLPNFSVTWVNEFLLFYSASAHLPCIPKGPNWVGTLVSILQMKELKLRAVKHIV